MRRILMLISGLLMLCGAAAQERQQLIQVQGRGAVAVTPDVLHFAIFIEERGDIASKLNARVEQKTAQIITLLEEYEVAPTDIQSMRINLHPWYERVAQQQVQKGFVLYRHVQVTLRNFDQYSLLMDGILKIGANRIDGFQYALENPEAAYLQALDRSIADAARRAKRIAAALNVSVGPVYDVIESGGYQPVAPRMEMRMLAADGADSNRAGEIAITADVQVAFRILE